MSKSSRRLLATLLILLIIALLSIPAQAQEDDNQSVVHAVLFHSPDCGHCENLIQNILPPLLAEYGDQLKIVAINVTTASGQELYQAAVAYYQIPDDHLGVPTMVIDDIVLVGGGEIPNQFPGILANSLSTDGVDWPEIPGLAEVVANVKFSSQPNGSAQIDKGSDDTPSMLAKFLLDPVANSIAVIVLIGMIASVIWSVVSFSRPLPEKDFWPRWVIPALSVLGIGVAFYLTYVETSGVEALCGPIGDCNTVQLSPYAILFGFLHVGLLGLIGYALVLVGWAIYHFGPQKLRWISAIAVWGMAFFGVLFSIYLTFLEPFVIGATCMWCISSAVIMTLVYLAATGPAKRAWQEDNFDDQDIDDDENSDMSIEPTATQELAQEELLEEPEAAEESDKYTDSAQEE